MWHTHKMNTCDLKHYFYRPIITTSPVYYSWVSPASKGNVTCLCYLIIFNSNFPQDWRDPSALHESHAMLYMHSALTFQKTTALCIKVPRRANKEGIYDTVKSHMAHNDLGVKKMGNKSADQNRRGKAVGGAITCNSTQHSNFGRFSLHQVHCQLCAFRWQQLPKLFFLSLQFRGNVRWSTCLPWEGCCTCTRWSCRRIPQCSVWTVSWCGPPESLRKPTNTSVTSGRSNSILSACTDEGPKNVFF